MIFLDVFLHVSSLQSETMVLHELLTAERRQFNFLCLTIIFSMVEDRYHVSAQLWFPHQVCSLVGAFQPLGCSCSRWALGKSKRPCWTHHSSWGFINQGTMEWPGFKGTLKIILFQPPCCRRGHLFLDSFLRAPSILALNNFREGASTTFHVRHYITKWQNAPSIPYTTVPWWHSHIRNAAQNMLNIFEVLQPDLSQPDVIWLPKKKTKKTKTRHHLCQEL